MGQGVKDEPWNNTRAQRKAARAGFACGPRKGRYIPHSGQSIRPYSRHETEFIMAMDAYKRETGHKFPSWTEALHVLESLGWHK